MELIVSDDSYFVKKIEVAAALANIKLNVRKGASDAEIRGLDARAHGCVLRTSLGAISPHTAILRYVSQLSQLVPLYGENEFDAAAIDQWISVCWQRIEVPLQILLENKSKTKVARELVQKAERDVKTELALLDQIFNSKTFIVGERITAADICILVTLQEVETVAKIAWKDLPSLKRWFDTAKASTQPPPSAAAAAAPKVDNSPVAMTATASPSASSVVVQSSPEIVVSGKWNRGRIRIKELLGKAESMIGSEVTVKGWVRTSRTAEKGQTCFVELNDGSTVKGIQLVLNSRNTTGFNDVASCGGAGASLSVSGNVVASPAKGQVIEIHVTSARVLGPVFGGDKGEIGGKNYPLAKKQHSLEFLREKAHLRPRSKMFSSAMRMRHAMAFATHKFFNDRGFVYTHTPLITAADCEGAGEQFVVTTLLPEHGKITDIPSDKAGRIDYSKDFFSRRCCLTVSGQLNVETHACALSDVYTFGPTFRAENSHTARHLAEFWMIEPEICFADLQDDMALAEDYVRYCAAYALEHCADDLAYFEDEYPNGEKGLRARLRNVAESEFARITYTEAVELLIRDSSAGKVQFEKIPAWGDDLGSEHERYIAERVYQRPTIVTNYPKGIKAFYMKLNEDRETVAAMDILVPKIGELIGGSQREDNFEILQQRCIESGLNPADIWWYADLRKYGTVPHAGFGLGFERLIMFVTGLENIRDVISFPRVPGHAEF